MESERIRKPIFSIAERVVSAGYELEIKNPASLDILRINPDNPAVIYFNHLAKDEPLLLPWLIKKYAPERLSNLVMPVSEWNAQFKNYPLYFAAVSVGRNVGGFKMPEIVQSYDTRSPDTDDELKEKSRSLALAFFKDLEKEYLPGNALVLISPEGHRSDNGKLLPAERGLGMIVKKMSKLARNNVIKDGYFIPLGLTFPNYQGPEFHYNPINKGKVNLIVGNPISLGEAFEKTREKTRLYLEKEQTDSASISHYLMSRLASLLPEEMRGVYSDELIEDTFNRRYEIRLKGSRKERQIRVFDTKQGNFIDL